MLCVLQDGGSSVCVRADSAGRRECLQVEHHVSSSWYRTTATPHSWQVIGSSVHHPYFTTICHSEVGYTQQLCCRSLALMA